MSALLNFMYNNFGITLWLTLILFIIICVTVLFMIFMSIMLFLDSIYRPNMEQYPFNIYLDRIIPFITLLFPSIIILILQPFTTWLARFTLFILIHAIILAPLYHHWSKLRHWKNKQNENIYNSWNHPRLYENIAIAMIYPLLWGVFFSLSRFFRLGTTYHVWDYIISLNSDLVIIFFILPYVIIWCLIIFSYILKIRSYLWNECYLLIYSLHIYLLQYHPYFRFMELIYKSNFFITCILTLNISYKNKGPWWQHCSNYLFYKPKIINIIVFGLVVIEVILTKKIYYGVYVLFIYIIIYKILSCYFAFGQTEFVFDCCLSDYCYLTYDNNKIKFPQRFWFYFQDADYYFGFEYQYTEAQRKLLSTQMNKTRWILRKKISQDLHQDYLNVRILKKAKSTLCLKLAASYLQTNRVRWVHTERVIIDTFKYHSCVALFARNIFDKIVLLNNNWSNLHHIQAARIPTPNFQNIYRSFNQTFTYHRKTFIGFQEENIPSNFVPLIENNDK